MVYSLIALFKLNFAVVVNLSAPYGFAAMNTFPNWGGLASSPP